MKISKRYTDFQSETGFFLQYISFHFQRVGVTIEQVLSVLNWHDRYSIAYRKYADPQQHNRAIVAEMAELHKEGVELIRGLRQQMKNDKQITLTAEDHKQLGIRVDKKERTKPPLPTAPLLVTAKIKTRSNQFRCVTYDETGKRRYYIPHRTQLIIKVAYSSDAKPEAKDYEVAMISTKATFTIITPPEIRKGQRDLSRRLTETAREKVLTANRLCLL